MPYRLSPKAEADLIGIADYIALDNPTAAERMIDRLEKACAMIGEKPLLGRARPEIAPNARSWVVGNYLVLYRQSEAGAEIIRVTHGARNLDDLDV